MIKNNKGFTLLEVLAVSVIIAILLGGSIAAYSVYMKKARAQYYDKQEDLITQATRDFFIDNRGKLPQAQDEERCVLLDTLIKYKYISNVVDYSKKSCSPTESKGCAIKLSKNKYLYYSKLVCGNSYQTVDAAKPVITMTPSKGTNKTLSKNQDGKITMKIGYSSDTPDEKKSNISSYRYVIYRTDKDNRVVYDTGWKTIKNSSKSFSVDATLDSKGTYFIKGWTYNEKGKGAEGESGRITLDYDLNCSRDIKLDSGTYQVSSTKEIWSSSNIETIIRTSGAVSRYTLEVINNSTSKTVDTKNIDEVYYKYALKDEGVYGYKITAYDDENKSCVVNSSPYRIDKTPPKCSVTADKTGWTKEGVTLTAICSENSGSGCKNEKVVTTLTNDINEEYRVRNVFDKAGNEALCNGILVQIDKTPPILTVIGRKCTNASSSNNCKNSYVTTTPVENTTSNNYDAVKQTTTNTVTSKTINFTKYSTDGLYFSYEAKDNNFDHAIYEYNDSGEYDSVLSLSNGSDVVIGDNGIFTITAGGKRNARITAYDKAGNKSYVDLNIYIAKNYKLTYNNNNGEGCTSKTVTKQSNSATWGSLCTPTRTGYNFSGWYTAATGGTQVKSSTKVTGNQTVYAHWTPKTVVVTYKPNGGTGSNGQDTFTYGVASQSFTNQGYTRTGYTQDGWALTAGGEKKYNIAAAVTDAWKDSNSPTKTLYAHWRANVCTITYSPNGGKFTSNSSDVVQNLNYGSSTSNMRNANGGYYSAEKSGYSIVSGKEWINGSKTYNQGNGYDATDFCPNLGSGDQSVTLNVNWKKTAAITVLSAGKGGIKFCTLHNGGADGTGGSSAKSCTEEISGTNCYSPYNAWTSHGTDTYANMKITSVSYTTSGTNLNVKVVGQIFTGWVGTWNNLSYDKRYACLKKNNRIYTGSCTTSTVTITEDDAGNTQWGNGTYMGQGTTHTVTMNFTIANYESNSGSSYSLKMYKSGWEEKCSTRDNVNDQIFTFQTDYLFKIN